MILAVVSADRFLKRKFLVTGGCGFVGSHLCDALLSCGASVVCLDNLSAGKIDNIKHLIGRENFEFVQKDIRDLSGENDHHWFKDVDLVFHNAASKKNICLLNPAADMEVNGIGILRILELMKSSGKGKLVHASTGSVYGRPTVFPTTEKASFAPVSHYGVSKAAAEHYIELYGSEGLIEATILRYFHVFGSRQESNEFGGVVSIFMRQAKSGEPLTIFGDGHQLRCFTHITDVINANILAAQRLLSGLQSSAIDKFNVASSNRVTILELAEYIQANSNRYLGSETEIKYCPALDGDIHFFDVCSKKIENDLGLTFRDNFFSDLRELLQSEWGT